MTFGAADTSDGNMLATSRAPHATCAALRPSPPPPDTNNHASCRFTLDTLLFGIRLPPSLVECPGTVTNNKSAGNAVGNYELEGTGCFQKGNT
jgi:hypothetical protein